ncbi:MAG: right-handed parallel beta-helix repeat-containing protein [Pseudomonadota bacterium]
MTINRFFPGMAVLLLALLRCAAAHAYDMPIGIPAPDFGSALGNPINAPLPAHPAAWPTGEAPGYYYIDNTAANATDSANPYGYPNRPRLTIPLSLPAGSVAEVRGGPYRFARDANFTLNGNVTRPVYLYGVNHPVLQDPVKTLIHGAYFVFDGFTLRNTRIQTVDLKYAVIRNSEVAGNAATTNGIQVSGSNIALYDNAIHHHQGDDMHGIVLTEGSHHVWILGNRLSYNGGDGIQFCHDCATSPPTHVYIGGNTIHGNRENGIDLKYCSSVILSQNEVYNHWPTSPGVKFCYDDGSGCTTGSSGSDGVSILAGSNGRPDHVWILFNHVHDSNKGIRVEEAYNSFVLGNVIHDVAAMGLEFGRTGEGPAIAAFNTIHNTATGIKGPWEAGDLKITMEANILSHISGDSIDIDDAPAAQSSASNNLFYNDGGAISVRWNSHITTASGADIDAIAGGSGNLIGDPMFRNPAAADFHVLPGGAGIDQAPAVLADLNTRFRSRFGGNVSILRDFSNTPRPLAGLDIGAYENHGVTGESPPAPPLLF